ncbi:hypothetical protein niasHT_000458 [Heterodera trifolii]|uniref:Uncharacterized protein n=1 Tax=Heterodera trifolii TaxID=157864 RepID=A0ABD2M304_9BILA
MSIIQPAATYPTNLTWMVLEGCVCPRPDAVCIRPVDYTKPVECIHVSHVDDFSAHLMSKPCDNTDIMNITELINGLRVKGTGCVNSLNFVFFLFIFMAQVCIFWAILLNVPERLRRIERLRPRRPPVANNAEGHPRTLRVLVRRERSFDHQMPAESAGRERPIGTVDEGEGASTEFVGGRLSPIEEADEAVEN